MKEIYAALGLPPHQMGFGSRYTDADLLLKLVDLLRAEGRLSAALVRASRDVPSYATYHYRFGSVQAAIDQARRLAGGSE